jgi:hypothetical protein
MAQSPVDIEVRGLRELEHGARALFHNIDEGAEREFASTAEQVASMVRSRQPHRTGALAATVDAGPGEKGASVSLGGSLPYAGWIEFGGTRGRPYIATGRTLFPTAEAAAPMFGRAGETVARNEIRSMHWPTPSPL